MFALEFTVVTLVSLLAPPEVVVLLFVPKVYVVLVSVCAPALFVLKFPGPWLCEVCVEFVAVREPCVCPPFSSIVPLWERAPEPPEFPVNSNVPTLWLCLGIFSSERVNDACPPVLPLEVFGSLQPLGNL